MGGVEAGLQVLARRARRACSVPAGVGRRGAPDGAREAAGVEAVARPARRRRRRRARCGRRPPSPSSCRTAMTSPNASSAASSHVTSTASGRVADEPGPQHDRRGVGVAGGDAEPERVGGERGGRRRVARSSVARSSARSSVVVGGASPWSPVGRRVGRWRRSASGRRRRRTSRRRRRPSRRGRGTPGARAAQVVARAGSSAASTSLNTGMHFHSAIGAAPSASGTFGDSSCDAMRWM